MKFDKDITKIKRVTFFLRQCRLVDSSRYRVFWRGYPN